jgi:2-polyprenyl-3-methyl-5-hydroxy-6-metoxy-1,4-benzoquinol methylase
MNKSTKMVIDVFDSWALSGRSETMADGHNHSVNMMLNMLNEVGNYNLMDVGCGNGWVVRKAAMNARCNKAVGVDVSPSMIEIAKQKKLTDKEQYICEDFCELVLDDSFDIILSMEVMYYIKPLVETLEKIYSLLKNGGVFIMGVDYYMENEESHSWPEMVGLEMQLMSMETWKCQLQQVGFDNIVMDLVKDTASQEEWKREVGTLVIKGMKVSSEV